MNRLLHCMSLQVGSGKSDQLSLLVVIQMFIHVPSLLQLLWNYKLNLTKDPKFESVAVEVCKSTISEVSQQLQPKAESRASRSAQRMSGRWLLMRGNAAFTVSSVFPAAAATRNQPAALQKHPPQAEATKQKLSEIQSNIWISN